MAKNLMNEAELYLLKHWEEARLLEESMESVRAKFMVLSQRVVDAVSEAHPKLDASGIFMTQSWSSGEIAIGNTSWPMKDNKYPTGLWLYYVSPDYLTAVDSDDPGGMIWVAKKDIPEFDFAAARVAIMGAAQAILTVEELNRVSPADSNDTLIFFEAPSKSELLEALTADDGERFVELLVSQFDFMARFIPALDQIFQGYAKGK